jgi:hypothetical protein
MVRSDPLAPNSRFDIDRRSAAIPLGTGVLGVGVHHHGALARFLENHPHAVDFVSVSPASCWIDRGASATPRFVPRPEQVAAFDALAERHPLIAHGVALSLAADEPALEQLARWRGRFDFRWTGVHVDDEVGAIERVRTMQRTLDCRVLLAGRDPEVVQRLCAATGCGARIALHGGPHELAHAQEIEVSRAIDLPHCPELRAITFVMDAPCDEAWLVEQLAHARASWRRRRSTISDALPLTLAWLGERAQVELTASNECDARRFGAWLEQRVIDRVLADGAWRDCLHFELAMLRTTGQRVLTFRFAPSRVLSPTPGHEPPLCDAWVLVDGTFGEPVFEVLDAAAVRRLAR